MAKLHFYYSAMNAGKSTTLLQSAHNYQERGMDVLLYTFGADNRYGEGKVASRIGLNAPATQFDAHFNLYEHAAAEIAKKPSIRCLLIDEAQFLNKAQVKQLVDVTLFLKRPVLAYGLRSDFRGEPFEGSQYLLAWAEDLNEIKTVCHCGRKATMNIRVDEQGRAVQDGAQVEIGGNDRYVSVCREHFESARRS